MISEEEFQMLISDMLEKISSVEQSLWYLTNETELDMIGATYALSNLKGSCNEIASEYMYEKNKEEEENREKEEEEKNKEKEEEPS